MDSFLLLEELDFLRKKRHKLTLELSNLDTEIIGLKLKIEQQERMDNYTANLKKNRERMISFDEDC